MRLQPAAWAAIALLYSATTLAAPTARDRASARALAVEAQKSMKAGAYAEAATALERALALDPSEQLRLDLARARIRIGKLVEAKELVDALADPALTPKPNKRVVAAATKLQAELATQVPSLLVTVSGVEAHHAIVELDGKVITAREKILVNPGEHALTADADGMTRATQHVTVAEGQETEVTLHLVSATPIAAPPPARAGSKVPAIIALSVGGAGLAIGAIFGGLALSDKGDAEAYCKNGRCAPSARSSIDASLTKGNVSTAAFIVGGVGVALGTVLWFTVGSKKTEPEQARVTPWIGAGEVGLRGKF
jgi:hypothetical protein